jgi:hypothetical protein
MAETTGSIDSEPREATGNVTTRGLCSAVLIYPSFAELVFSILCIRNIRTLAPSPGIDLATLARHATWVISKRCGRSFILTGVFAMIVLSLPLVVVMPLLWLLAATILLVGALVWLLVDELRIHQEAVRIADSGADPELGYGLVDANDEARLAAVNESNLSIYAPELDTNPFAGMGQLADSKVTRLIEVDKAKDPEHPMEPFTASELLEHLALQVPQHLTLNGVNDSCDGTLVMFVRGPFVRRLPWLLPEARGAPIPKVSVELLRENADQPEIYARTYLRVQIVSHQGRVVTTFHMTAVNSALGLSLDLGLHVLRPIHPAFYRADRLPRRSRPLAWELLVRGFVFRNLLLSPLEAWRTAVLLGGAGRDAELSSAQQKAVGVQDFYGTFAGLREVVSVGTDLGYHESVDAERQCNEMITAVVHELISFLETRNIDTTDLRKQRLNIEQHFSTKVDQIVNGVYHGGIKANGSISIGGNVQANAGNLPNIQEELPNIQQRSADAGQGD